MSEPEYECREPRYNQHHVSAVQSAGALGALRSAPSRRAGMSPTPAAEPPAASPASASVSGAAASDALSAKVAGIQLSRRRPDFTLPPMHRDLRLSSHAPLEAASAEGGGARVFCRGCRCNRRFFCHECLVPLVDGAPVVRLPCRAYFVTDDKERLSKATGAQCATLAPDQVSLCAPSELPELDPETTVLLLPAEDAMDVATLVRRLEGSGEARGKDEPGASPRGFSENGVPKRNDASFRLAVVVIDSKWDVASAIARGERMRDLPRVRLSTYRTSFWRYHPRPKANGKRDEAERRRARGEDDGDEMLCSLEALFFFARELHENGFGGASGSGSRECGVSEEPRCAALRDGGEKKRGGDATCHCHDDLFWFFAYQHSVVAKGAAARTEFHPVPPQPRRERKGRAARRTERRNEASAKVFV